MTPEWKSAPEPPGNPGSRLDPAGQGAGGEMEELVFLREVLESVRDAVVAVDEDFRVTYWNHAAEQLFGHAPAYALGALFHDLADFGWTEWERETRTQALRQQGRWEEEASFQPPHRRGKRHVSLFISRLRWGTRHSGSLVVARDITQQVRDEEQLLYTATHDALTGLANRSLFVSRLWKALGEARSRPERRYAVFFIDLDRFKRVNDSLGHHAGDRLLLQIAQRLRGCLGTDDLPARLGGDEFALLLHPLHREEEAAATAERLLQCMADPFFLESHEISIGASIGYVVGDARYTRPEDILRDADAAMYRAKAAGSGLYAAFEPGARTRQADLIGIGSELRRGLAGGAFVAHYQPIVRLTDGSVSGFEALGRWRHPVRGLLPPSEYLAQAEELGIITEIERATWRDAARQLRAWQQDFPDIPLHGVSVNVANVHLHRPDFVTTVRAILSETGLAPEQLTLEITERVFLPDADVAATGLPALHEMGVRLALDDFGTGFSALSMLHKLPIDILKVDRSFTQRIVEEKGLAMVRAIADMADVLGLDVVVEGIETAEQLALVRSLGCEYGQGFLFSPPVSALAAAGLLAHPPWRSFWP